MLIDFFLHLKAKKLPVSTREFLTLLEALKERVATLNGWMADVKTGERLTFIRKPGAGLQVDVNGTVKGTIKGDDFAKAFVSIWLGADPPNPEIKAGLLGGTCGQ